ncbi:PqiC family protein [Catenovulum sediminis]|uniref:ABC-type transport auxiliary lipoprotein family protein n=1 Tax=Catenovulum sediminis TaxID=1740262 RepID=A0ABV1RHZ5_9ALTE
MNFIKITLIAIVSSFLFACSSQPEPSTQYYLFPYPENKALQQRVEIALNLELAPYLKTDSIALLKEGNLLQFAHYHRWAQPLQVSINESLVDKLSNQLPGKVVDDINQLGGLQLQIVRFHGNLQGEVVLIGAWSIAQQKPEKFILRMQQSAEGYDDLVSTMDLLLDKLVQQIVKQLI